eukprot:CAMPEP_0113679828 /NCGR_PEP_ID=MMETSP0038_2-20120614/10900_1 /TAXON_ID=2898 /ORGANISM="Cryptomonas paramecium" /LENGTH=575 /DNA_ID=CAMNT_0000597981 /DNA_START=164 /DNA_END=1888 /DNA_ORIENTATION=- /assembly_acc=CAM_ASM_000170
MAEPVHDLLKRLDQSHLLEGLSKEQNDRLVAQVTELNGQIPGGLESYIKSARKLLEDSAAGVNPFAGFTPKVPAGDALQVESEAFAGMEALGAKELPYTGFVLVAGGLGERLGYNGIKVSLPLYLTEPECFLGLYIQHILAFQKEAGGRRLPLAIMTSDDTHKLTVELLEKHNNFGMDKDQITVMKQNKVPALLDIRARMAGKDGVIETKPHGHGDVHTLMHQFGLAAAWRAAGFKWVFFFQDTNGLAFRALPAVLGVSASKQFDVNSVCVPRTAKEAVGGICRLEHSDGRCYTVNVEYNQLDPLLKSTKDFPDGDVPDPKTGFSPFPGNINNLVLGLERYQQILEQTGGRVNEFVNPKYADAPGPDGVKVFKSPTRLECMMQDYPMLLPPTAKVGFTQLDRWVCFSPVKNNLADAAAKAAKSLPPECAGTAERDALAVNNRFLKLAGADGGVAEGLAADGTFAGVPLKLPPLVTLMPSFASTLSETKARIKPDSKVSVTARSALTLQGDVFIDGTLELDGALVVRAGRGSRVVVKKLKVVNAGWVVTATEGDSDMTRMRGYAIDRKETREIVFG